MRQLLLLLSAQFYFPVYQNSNAFSNNYKLQIAIAIVIIWNCWPNIKAYTFIIKIFSNQKHILVLIVWATTAMGMATGMAMTKWLKWKRRQQFNFILWTIYESDIIEAAAATLKTNTQNHLKRTNTDKPVTVAHTQRGTHVRTKWKWSGQ